MKILIVISLIISLANCSQSNNKVNRDTSTNTNQIENRVDFWLTKADESVKLQKQTGILAFGSSINKYLTIDVDASQSFQTIDGFGFTLTGGSADVINRLNTDKKQELLKKLFGQGKDAISISYLRISIGASDLNEETFSYSDLPDGQTDINLDKFSLGPDKISLIPLLKEILRINPTIKIMGSPWSAPPWMKDNNNTKGGSLQRQYYGVYAQYFVKFIQKMKDEGIAIDAITPQNEPLHPGNNPSMYMTAVQQADFIKNHLGPAFNKANIDTKIIIYDHNCDKPEYPISILDDAEANSYINGSAFHLYGGDISAMTTVHNAHPDKDLYFTEQYTSSKGEFKNDLKWSVKNVIIGSTRNWSKIALEWNLANDASFKPHTSGGCTICKGAITINDASSYTQNVGYYIIAHASKFVPVGSVRIFSNIAGNLYNIAFKTPEGKKVLIVENDGDASEQFNIKYKGEWVSTSLGAGSVGTYIW